MMLFIAGFVISWLGMHNLIQSEYLFKKQPTIIVSGQTSGPLTFEFHPYKDIALKGPSFDYPVKEGAFRLEIPVETEELLDIFHFQVVGPSSTIVLDSLRILGYGADLEFCGEDIPEVFRYIQFSTSSDLLTLEDGRATFRNSADEEVLLARQQLRDDLEAHVNDQSLYWSLVVAIPIALLLSIFGMVHRLSRLAPHQVLLCVGFLALISFALFSKNDNQTLENRTLAPWPDVFNTHIWDLPELIDAWYSDHFPFRSDLAKTDNVIKYQLFGVSNKPTHVLFNGDWLFLALPDVRESYMGEILFSEEELETIRQKLENRRDWLKSRGASFYLVLPPVKHEVYEDLLPRILAHRGPVSKLDQLMSYLEEHSDLVLIDLKSPLLQARKKHPNIYYETDTHWNPIGAHVAYETIINRIREDHPSVPAPFPLGSFHIDTGRDSSGDLVELINMKGTFDRTVFHTTPRFTYRAMQVKPPTVETDPTLLANSRFMSTGDTNLPDMVMIRDSYTEYLYHNLSEHFDTSSYYWTRMLPLNQIRENQPDIVIQQMLQRFINTLLEPDPEEIQQEVEEYRKRQLNALQASGQSQN